MAFAAETLAVLRIEGIAAESERNDVVGMVGRPATAAHAHRIAPEDGMAESVVCSGAGSPAHDTVIVADQLSVAFALIDRSNRTTASLSQ